MNVASHTRLITPPSVACAVHPDAANARRVRTREMEQQEDKTDQRVCVLSRGSFVLVSRPSRLPPSPLGRPQQACAPAEPDGSAPQHRQVRRPARRRSTGEAFEGGDRRDDRAIRAVVVEGRHG
jgi:hypothetical protein